MGFKKRKKFTQLGYLPRNEATIDKIIAPTILGSNPACDLLYDSREWAERNDTGDDEGEVRRVRATVTIEIEEI